MQITPHFHVLNIPFTVPMPTGPVPRSVNVVLVCSETITLVDCGTAGSEEAIFRYLKSIDRRPEEITQLLLTHSHPDHIGAARAVHDATGCRIAAHGAETAWIEDVELQARERPVPGFFTLVGGSVPVHRRLVDGETINLGPSLELAVLHTPGHSGGSLSFNCRSEGVLLTGDAIPVPREMPIFEEFGASQNSLRRLSQVGAHHLVSSWEPARTGAAVPALIADSLSWTEQLKRLVERGAVGCDASDPMALSRWVVAELGMPPYAVNPLVARSLTACLAQRG